MARFATLVVFIHLMLIRIPVCAQGQQAQASPKLAPSNISIFDIDVGLPISCTQNGLLDKAGRLWINPCYAQEEHRTVNFYQFDGIQSTFIEWENFPETLGGQAALSGFTETGELFGFFRNTGTCFFFNQDTRKARYHVLDTAGIEICFMGITKAHGIILYALSKTQHLIYRIDQNGPQLIRALKRAVPKEVGNYNRVDNPILTETDLWFFDCEIIPAIKDSSLNVNVLIQASLGNQDVRQYSLKDLFGGPPPPPEKMQYERILAPGQHGAITLFLKAWNQYFQVDAGTGTVHLFSPFPTTTDLSLYSGHFIGMDQAGNLLFCHRKGSTFQAVMRDNTGQYYDYSSVIDSTAKASRYHNCGINAILSVDFRSQLYVFLTTGLATVALKLSGSIKNYLDGFPMRTITEINPGQYVVVPEGKNRLLLFNPESVSASDTSKPLILDCDISKSPGVNYMATIAKDPAGYFWTSYNKNLVRFRETGICSMLPVGVNFKKFAFLNTEMIALEGEGTFYLYNLPGQKRSPYLINGLPVKLKGVVNQVHVSKDSVVWIAGLDGLHKIDLRAGNYRLIGTAEGFQDKRMMCIDEDSKGRLWIGTYGGGLHIYDPGSGAISIIDSKQGLSNNIVVGILVDDAGVRWLSTYKGITLVSAEGKVLTRLYKEDGLSTNEFNRYSYYKASTGHLLFGSIYGINYIDPKAVKTQLFETAPPQIYLTGLSYVDAASEKPITQGNWPSNANSIKLSAAHRMLRLQFALSSLIRIEENRFAYKIEGLDSPGPSDWIFIGSNAELNLQSLPAGRYNILIRGSDYRGNWTRQPLVIPIQAAEFFYKQTWFIIVCLLTLAGLIFGWIFRLQLERKRLEKELQTRTNEIMRARDQLVVQEKLASLGQLTAGIAHEIKNPLNFVNNFAMDSSNLIDLLIDELEQVKAVLDPEHFKRIMHYLQDVKQNSLDIESSGITADRIVRSMMDHARGTPENMQFLNLNHLIEENIHLAISGFKASNPDFVIDFDLKLDPKVPQIYGSPLNIARALLNIFNNACYALYKKQTEQGNNFKAVLRAQTKVRNGFVEIRIRDNGPGIDPEIKKDIFTPFFTTKPTGAGNTGLGLSICFDIIVKEHSGQIDVESKPGEFTEFMLQLPITEGNPA